MAVKKYMMNIPKMETLPMFCILLLVGLLENNMETFYSRTSKAVYLKKKYFRGAKRDHITAAVFILFSEWTSY